MPTEDELWDAIAQLIDDPPSRFPSPREIKDLIWQARKANQRVLPEAKIDELPVREARIRLLAGVYSHQGDTPFYRGLLESKGGIWQTFVPRSVEPVTHEDVLDYLGNEIIVRPKEISLYPRS
jgi:hypothetical protein